MLAFIIFRTKKLLTEFKNGGYTVRVTVYPPVYGYTVPLGITVFKMTFVAIKIFKK